MQNEASTLDSEVERADRNIADLTRTVAEPTSPPHFGSKADILSANDLELRDVYAKRWGFWVRLRSLTAKERDRFEAGMQKEISAGKTVRTVRNLENVRARLLALTLVDANNANDRMFKEPAEILALGEKNADQLNDLFVEACTMNGITKEDVKKLEENLDEEAGDSQPT